MLSFACRLTLLKYCLSNILIYLLSIIKFSKWVIHAIIHRYLNFFGMTPNLTQVSLGEPTINRLEERISEISTCVS